MKNLFLLLTLAAMHAHAQIKTDETNYKWRIGVQISSPEDFTVPIDFSEFNSINGYGNKDSFRKDKSLFSYGLSAKYFIKEDIALRIRIGECNRKVLTHHEDTITYHPLVQDETLIQNSFYFAFGLEKNKSFGHFGIYTGIEILYYSFGNYTMDETGYGVTAGGNSWQENGHINHPGGYSLGIGGCLGANIFLYKGISIAPEISYALLYEKTGGNSIGTASVTGYYISNSTIPISYSIEKIGGSKIIGALNISYSF